jgi:hypothetical protein
MSELGLPKNLREAVPYIVWGVLVLGFGLEFCTAFVHEEWLRAAISFMLMCGLAAMVLYSKDVKTWMASTNPNYIAPAFMLLLLALILSPFVEQQRWPFAHLPTGRSPPPAEWGQTSLRVQFNSSGAKPQEIEAKNIEWAWATPTQARVRQPNPSCVPTTLQALTDPNCSLIESTQEWIVFLVFVQPIQLPGKITIDAHGAILPKWDAYSLTDRKALRTASLRR